MTTIDQPTCSLELRATENGRDFRVEPEGRSLTRHLGSGSAMSQDAREQVPRPGEVPPREGRSIDRIGEYLAGAAAGVWWRAAFVCRSASQLLEVWVKIGAETVIAVEPRSDARQFVLEFDPDGSLVAAYWVGSGPLLAFAGHASPANVAIPLPQVEP